MAENSLFLSGIEELKKKITELGMPAFRSNQIRDWIFKKFVFSFDEGIISKFLGRPNIQKLGNMAMYMFLLHYLPYIPYFFVTSTMGKIKETNFTNLAFIVFDLAFTFVSSIIIYKHDMAKKEKLLQTKQS